MKVAVAPGWTTELDHGPDWLFVKLYGPDTKEADATGLAESLQVLMREEFAHRVVVELDGLDDFPLSLVDELAELHGLVEQTGGIVRLCGIAAEHHEMLRQHERACLLTHYHDRADAVMGAYRPKKPR